MTSHVDHDGMFLELNVVVAGVPTIVADAFFSDDSGTMTLTSYDDDLPDAAWDWLVSEAWRRLPPTTDAV